MHVFTDLVGAWRRGPLALLVAAALALMLVAAACDDDSPPAAPADEAAGAADTAADAAAAATADDAAATFPVSYEDATGETVTFDAPPERIISLSPGATEILFALGAGGRVVAVDRFSDYPADTAALPQLEYSSPDPEAALALDPDLVILATRQREQVQQFRDLGMRVLFLSEPTDIEGVYAHVALLGALTGAAEQAAAVEAEMRGRIDAVAAEVADATPVRVLYELSPDLYTVAPDTFIGSLIAMVGGENIAAGATSPFPQLTAEAVLAADPEVVLLSDAESAGETAESVAARPGWDGVSAVTTGRIVPIDPDIVNRPGPRLADGIEAIARALHPDRF